MTISFQQKILNMTQKITFALGFGIEKDFKDKLKRLKPPKKEYHLCNEKEKFKILKFFDKFGMPQQEMLLPDLDLMNEVFSGFYQLFRVLRFHKFEEFDSLLKHAQLIDSLCETADSTACNDDAIQQCIDNLEEFFNGFGEMIPIPELDDLLFRCRKKSLLQDKVALDGYFAFLLFSIFAHLDAIIHHVAFPSIEPISLGGLFMKKPSQSLIKLMTAYVFYEKSNDTSPDKPKKMPASFYGLHLLNELKSSESDFDDKRGNLIKSANEGRGVSFQELNWILNDTNENLEDLSISKEVKIETLNIMKGLDSKIDDEKYSIGPQNLLSIWLVYWFFQTLYESPTNSNKKEIANYGHYYSRWAMFNQYYISQRKNEPEFKWSPELMKLAQPIVG